MSNELDHDDESLDTLPPMRSASRLWLWVVLAGALLGAFFASTSTRDFIQHLDRQQHSIHCSLMPGAAVIGESGCRTVMMSPYSSVFRSSLWGGIPISLFALAVFAYLAYRALALALQDRTSRRETGYLWLATGLPAAMSVIYGYISTQNLDALCTVCLGIYIASGASFLGAAMAYLADPPSQERASPWGPWLRWFAEGVAAVGVLTLIYTSFAPEDPRGVKGCGVLAQSEDPAKVLVQSRYGKGTNAIMVLDPLCPACRGFEERLAASNLGDKLNLRYALFPLDATCNWMVKTSLHPGACAVTEALLCKRDKAEAILSWAFLHQESLLASAKESDGPVRDRLLQQFPELRGCLGSNEVKAKVRNSLKWAVANAIPVLTPQLFLADRRMCDEDTDLGLEYTLTAMLKDLGPQGGRR